MVVQRPVPVRNTPEAIQRVEELGRQREFEQMLEHTRQVVPDLDSIEVERYDDPEDPGEPRVIITAWQSGPPTTDISVWDNWGHWFVRAFPPEVCRYFGFRTRYRK